MFTYQVNKACIIRAITFCSLMFLCLSIRSQDFGNRKAKYIRDTSPFSKAIDFHNKAKSAIGKGRTDEAITNYLATIEEYNSIYNSAKDAGNYELAINALIEKADIERIIYPVDTAFNSLDQASVLLRNEIPIENFLWFKTYLSYGQVAHVGSDFYRATDYLDSAQILYQKSESYDSSKYRDLLEYKFYGYLYSNKSIDTVQKYIDIRFDWESEEQKKDPNPQRLIYLLEDYPDIYTQKGEYEIALAYAISNYKFFNQNRSKIKNKDRYAEVYFDLALALFNKDQFLKSLQIVEEYLQSNESRINPRSYLTMISLAGLIHEEIGDHERALSYFQEFLNVKVSSFDEQSQRNHKIARATAYLNVGINLYRLEKRELALENYRKSLDEMKGIVEFPSTALINCYRYIGDFYVQEGQWEDALISYDSALRNTELKYTDPILEFPKTDSISRFSLESLTLLKKKSSAILNNGGQNQQRSLESVIEYVDKTDEKIRANREDLYKSDGKLFLSQFFKDMYETGIEACFKLYRLTGENKYARRAFEYAQRSKSNLFLEQEKDYKEFTSSDIPLGLKEEYYKSSARLENLKVQLYNALDNSVTGDSVLRLSDQIINLETQTESLRDSISENFELNGSEKSATIIAPDIKDRSILIEYFYGQKNVFAFGLNNEGDIFFDKTSNDQLLEESLEGFLEIVSTPPDYERFETDLTDYRKYAYNLYKRLLEPTLEKMPGSVNELIIVPDEFLTRVPFEAFLQDNGEGKTYWDFDYLIKSFNIRYLISSNRKESERSSIKKESKILGMGFSESLNTKSGSSSLSSLPGTEREIQFLDASFDGDYYLGAEGSRERFLSDAKDYDIIHLAVHGKADSSNRFQSSLIFNGKDSVLNTNQLYLANIRAQLAVLSACESGKGQIESGEGTFSIARGFAIVGVPNIVMSLWEVNDRTTSSQMVDFYNNFLNNGLDLNSSLRQVKLDYIKEGDSYLSHPYYWASFIHLGQNIEFEESFLKRNLGLAFLLMASASILIIMIFWYKKRKGIQ
ncbi:CHAT domain-containing tetratricopeptide repeat protein [Roseivirga sp.]|uniref:CHAT domain-containing protein n=1 Tax=Roseivirga sp. TaxID=1964215 RepID=UPI00235575B4|nr:CHAT domain-containing tetratricopeptide repeat protein [Roseivirga sp.]